MRASALSNLHFRVAGFARIRSVRQFTEVWRLQLRRLPDPLSAGDQKSKLDDAPWDLHGRVNVGYRRTVQVATFGFPA
jgi:hypothetical protein